MRSGQRSAMVFSGEGAAGVHRVKMSGGKCPTFDPIMAASDPAHLPVYLHAVVLRLRVKSAIRRLADFYQKK